MVGKLGLGCSEVRREHKSYGGYCMDIAARPFWDRFIAEQLMRNLYSILELILLHGDLALNRDSNHRQSMTLSDSCLFFVKT